MAESRVGILGATSMVGQSLVPLLRDAGHHVIAYSRSRQKHQPADSIEFRCYPASGETGDETIADWICLAPIWTFPEHFAMLSGHRVKRVVALSSTSIFSKRHSADKAEQNMAAQLARGEGELISWAEANGIEWVILRPTLIYGLGKDRNICEIARFIARFGFFPLFGKAEGLRQPVHVEDVAAACMAALQHTKVRNRSYEISGAEIMPYR
ncbi:MAG TPA: NAD(P)-dependent oxidoreductase, partial [Gallionella sp.]